MNLTLPDVIISDTYSNIPASDADGEGRLFRATDRRKWYRDSGSSFAGQDEPYSVVVYLADKPAAGAVLADFIPDYAVSFPTNLTGSTVRVGTNPTATATYSFKKNSSEFGTLAIATDGTPTWTCASGPSFNGTSDYLQIVAPASQDDTLAGVGICLKGTR